MMRIQAIFSDIQVLSSLFPNLPCLWDLPNHAADAAGINVIIITYAHKSVFILVIWQSNIDTVWVQHLLWTFVIALSTLTLCLFTICYKDIIIMQYVFAWDTILAWEIMGNYFIYFSYFFNYISIVVHLILMYCHLVAWLPVFMINSSFDRLAIAGSPGIMGARVLTKKLEAWATMVARALRCEFDILCYMLPLFL
jgi:hypothetical protein